MYKYTVWVTNFSVTARDTIFITTVEAANEDQAIVWAIEECADAWEEDIFDLVCLGVAEGVVNILQWDDNGITYAEATA